MSRFGPVLGPSGEIVQGGVAPRLAGSTPRYGPRGTLYRAIVLRTFTTDDPVRTEGRKGSTDRTVDVECDVVLTKSHVRLRRVPVLQRNHGLNDLHNVWIPRPCSRVINVDGTTDPNRQLNLRGVSRRGVPISVPPAFTDLDGDHVLVSFIDNDMESPVIVGALAHARTRRLVVSGSGWREDGSGAARGEVGENEFYTRHRGTEVRINDQGDLLFDALGATTNEENQSPGSGIGQIRFRVKDSTRLTIEVDGTDVLEVWQDGAQVRIDLGEGASESLILGDSFRSFLNDWLTHVFAQHQHLPGTLTNSGGAVTGLSGTVSPVTVPPLVPPPPLSYTGSQMAASLLSDLAKTKRT
jgi:hypothetical protein